MLIVALALAIFRIPLTADDYGLISASLKGLVSLWQVEGPLVARLPVGNSFSLVGLELGLWEKWPVLFLTFCFTIHATAFALLVDWLSRLLAVKEVPPLMAFLVFLPFVVFPNNHEMQLWYSIAMFQIGALAAVLGLRSKESWPRIFFFAVAFLSYETFVFLVVGALSVEWVMGRRFFRQRALELVIALALMVAVRGVLTFWIGGTNQRQMILDPWAILRNLPWILKSMIVLNFRKENWPIGVVEWIAIGLLLFLEARRNWRGWLVVLFVPLVCAFPAALLPYQASRALYGPDLLRSAILCVLTLSLVSRRNVPAWLKACPIVLFIVAYGFQWGHILSIKDRNARALATLEKETQSRILACATPCTLSVPRPDSVVAGDWVIHPGFFASFYERLRLETAPTKAVNFVIQ